MKLNNTIKALQDFGSNVVREGKAILTKEKKTTSSNTLYNDFNYIVEGRNDGADLIFDFGGATKYWDFVNEGVKGSGGFKGSGKMRGQGSPYQFRHNNIKQGVIDRWIVSKPLKQARDKNGKFIPRKSMAFLIGRAVAQRGLTRTLFFTKPFEKEFKKQENEIVDALGKDIDIYIGDIYST